MSGAAGDRAVSPRELWRHVEAIHAVVYFADEVARAVTGAGVTGWWRGYVAGRAAPLGPCPSPVVEALFFGFAPQRIERHVPEVWSTVTPEALLSARVGGVRVALERIVGDAATPSTLARIDDLLGAAVEGAACEGRALYAAHRSLDDPGDVLASVWHRCTLLREHRGDGHVAVLVAAGLDGAEANLLASAAGVVPDGAQQRRNRGWSEDEWAAAADRLEEQGHLDDRGRLTPVGRALRDGIESRTDELAAGPLRSLGPEGAVELLTLLAPLVDAVVASGTVGFPNAMGLTDRPGHPAR